MKPSSLLHRIRTAADHPAGSIRSRSDASAEPWGDFVERARALAAGLAGYGFGPGDRAAIVGPFGPDVFQGVLAVWVAGGTAVPIGRSVADLDLQGALRSSRARIVLAANSEDLDRVLRVRPELPDLELILVFRAEDGDRPSPARTTRDVEATGRFGLQQAPDLLADPVPVLSVVVLAVSAEGPATRRRDWPDLDRGASELGQRLSLGSSDRVVLSLQNSGGVELDAARVALERGAELVFLDPDRLGPDTFRTVRPTRALVVPEVVVGLEAATESTIAARGFFGRARTNWALRAADNEGRAPRRARVAERWVLRDLREQVSGGCLTEILCAGTVPAAPRLRSLGVLVRPLGGPA